MGTGNFGTSAETAFLLHISLNQEVIIWME